MIKVIQIWLWSIFFLVFLSCGEQGKPSTESTQNTRHIKLDGQSNFRDLGGYKASDGRTLKWGKIYRSGELPRLSDKDVEILDSLGIRTVVNFLTDQEIAARGSDRLPEEVNEIRLPIDTKMEGGGLAEEVLKARKTGDFSKVPVEINPLMHRILINEAAEQYSRLLRTIIEAENLPVVLHCSHGIHRTGTATAIILSVLGVPWETVREDYLLSNSYRAEEIEQRLAQLKLLAAENQGIQADEVDMTNAKAFYVLQDSYIDASLDEAVKKYGSMENYLQQALGISADEIQKLKDILLE